MKYAGPRAAVTVITISALKTEPHFSATSRARWQKTASIFCETLSFDAALKPTREEKIALLNTTLERNFGVIVDIHSRFLFESRVFERREERRSHDLGTEPVDGSGAKGDVWRRPCKLSSLYVGGEGTLSRPYVLQLPICIWPSIWCWALCALSGRPPLVPAGLRRSLIVHGMADAAALGKRFSLDIQLSTSDGPSLNVDLIRLMSCEVAEAKQS